MCFILLLPSPTILAEKENRMNKLKYFIIENLDYMYLGGALVCFADIDVLKWEFYAIIIPFAFIQRVVKNKL